MGEEGPGDPRESPTGVFAPESKQLTPLCRYPADDIKAKEANEIADWIETARAAKAKEAAELAEWKRKAQASNSAIGL